MTPRLIKVLLVEDDLGDAFWIQELLETAERSFYKFELQHCTRLSEALHYLAVEKPDAILLDLGLPDSQGMQTLTSLIDVVPDLPVVVLTGLADEEFGAAAVHQGAQDYLIKGQFNQDLLIRSLRYAVERQQAEEALRRSERIFRRLAEANLMGVGFGDSQGNVSYVNDEMLRMMGYQRADYEAGRINWAECLAPEYRADNPRLMEQLRRDGQITGDERAFLRPDGGRTPHLAAAALVAPGEDLHVSIALDLTKVRTAEQAQRESEERLRLAVQGAGMGTWDEDLGTGRTVWSRTHFEILGYPPNENGEATSEMWRSRVYPDDLEGVIQALEMARVTGSLYAPVHRIIRADNGEVRWLSVFGRFVPDPSGEPSRFVGIFFDITERQRAEEERQLAIKILGLVNAPSSLGELTREVTKVLQEWSGCEAVGIRLRQGEGFPYFETRGFPAEFVELENWLCAKDQAGELIRDSAGNPVIECMCGNVISGRVNPGMDFFTPGGSFWTNSTTRLLASTSEKDRQARTRNRCHGEGYESVALVPLKSGQKALGLLQFNDRTQGKFTLEKIQLFERLADNLASGIARRQTEEALRESEERYRSLFENSHAVMLLIDPETGRIMDANPMACLYYGYSREGLLNQNITDINILSSEEVFQEIQQAKSEQGKHFEFRHRLASGEIRDVEVFSGPIRIKGRELLYSIVHDDTARKQAEKTLKRQHAILDGISRVFQEALTCETEAQLGETCLAAAEVLTGSKFSFIGELNREGKLDDLAISYPGWQACNVPGTKELVLPKNLHIHGIYGGCLREGRSAIVNDPATHLDRIGLPAGHPPITSFLGVPLKHGTKTIGLIGLGNKAGGYTEADREAVEALAPAIVEALMRKKAELAVRQARDKLEQRVTERTADLRHTVEQLEWEITERQRVEEALRESEERLRFLASQLLSAQEKERKRLAWELHDDLGQSLMVLKMQLRAVERKLPFELAVAMEELGHSLNYINEMIENVRRMSHDLLPSVLENLGLKSAVEYLCEEFSKLNEIQVSLDMEDLQDLLSEEAQIAVYRVFQESLSNIAKHAQATQIKVAIKPQDGKAACQVEDNGNGFELQEVLSEEFTKRGLGLTAMDERVRLLGGELHISSKPGTGTKITFIVPMNLINSLE